MSSTMTLGMSKVFILDKYFNELQKFWDTEQRLQDTTSSGEAVNLQNKLRHLSTELVGLRNRLHENQGIGSSVSKKSSSQSEGFNTLRSVRNHDVGDSFPVAAAAASHHDYSNIQHPIPLPISRPHASSSEGSLVGLPPPPSLAVPLPPKEELLSRPSLVRRSTSSTEALAPASSSLSTAEMNISKLMGLKDLIHLDEHPLSEDHILRALQARFQNQNYFTNIGPIVLSVNSYRNIGNPLTLNSTRDQTKNADVLRSVVSEALRLQSETGYPQAIIVSGGSGSGKSFTSMVLLRQLFDLAGGGQETDTFKHLAASFSVLRSLGMAKTASNRESSRIGHFIEVQVSDRALYRTKIHCYFLDQSRVVHPLPMEKNYHIFYQMLAGLSTEERSLLGLENYTLRDLNFLNEGDIRQNEEEDAERFAVWKDNLSVLGIPFMDVVRVLASILLLGNVHFTEGKGLEVEILGQTELRSVSSLLGVSFSSLCQGLTVRTYSVRGQLVKSMSDANMAVATRNALAKALYCRTVATIVRRANSLKRPVGALSGTLSSDSNESVHQEIASQIASTVGTTSSRKSRSSMAILNNAVRHATDGFIGILDMFGFEDSKPSRLEHLCINLCSETMQHFYNTHIFKSSIESCRDEGILPDLSVDYVDNVPCIDLISSLRTGLLSMLDVECSVRGCPETYVQKVKIQHKENSKLYEPKHCDSSRTFAIYHYAGQVVYDTSDFLDTNRDVIPDDLLCVFDKESCNFGFVTHLFINEIKALRSQDIIPRGISFRISPSSSHPELLNGDEPVSTLTQDFHTRLDNLLRTLVHAKPHFVRCLKPNINESSVEFDRTLVVQQIRSLQILETVNLMSRGFPHRMRFKVFHLRYRCLAKHSKMLQTRRGIDDKAIEDCKTLLHVYKEMEGNDWAFGRKHVFLSEMTRQNLERLREEKRQTSATRIQALYRGYSVRLLQARQQIQLIRPKPLIPCIRNMRPRPQPISGTPPPGEQLQSSFHSYSKSDRCDFQTIQQTCALFGLDLERPPPVPASRPYTIVGSKKIAFPQLRTMKASYPEDGSGDILLHKGETVVVIGVSTRRSHLVVEKRNHTIHVPHSLLELKNG